MFHICTLNSLSENSLEKHYCSLVLLPLIIPVTTITINAICYHGSTVQAQNISTKIQKWLMHSWNFPEVAQTQPFVQIPQRTCVGGLQHQIT